MNLLFHESLLKSKILNICEMNWKPKYLNGAKKEEILTKQENYGKDMKI